MVGNDRKKLLESHDDNLSKQSLMTTKKAWSQKTTDFGNIENIVVGKKKVTIPNIV